MKTIARIIYGLVGLAGLFGLGFILFGGSTFWGMPIKEILTIILLTIGGVNWGIVAITGKREKDLLQLLGW